VSNFKLLEIFSLPTVTFLFVRSPIRHGVDPHRRPYAHPQFLAGVGRLSLDHLNRVGCLYSKESWPPEENISLNAGNPTECLARSLGRAKVKI